MNGYEGWRRRYELVRLLPAPDAGTSAQRDESRLTSEDRAAMVTAARGMAEKTGCESAIHSAAVHAIGCTWMDLRDSELAYVDQIVVWALEYRRLGGVS